MNKIQDLSVKFWNSLNKTQQEEYTTLLKYFKKCSYNKAIYKLNKKSIENAVNGSVKSFCHSHPKSFKLEYVQSLAKRISGTLTGYIKENKTLSKSIKVKKFCTVCNINQLSWNNKKKICIFCSIKKKYHKTTILSCGVTRTCKR